MANTPILENDNLLISKVIPNGKLITNLINYSQGGGPSVEKFVINFTNEDDTITSDKTIQEIIDAYNNGQIIEGLYMFEDLLAPIVLEPTFIAHEENVYSAIELLGTFDTGDEMTSYAVIGVNDGVGDEWSGFAREIVDTSELSDYVNDPSYVHTDNNFTNEYKTKLDGLENKIITVNANQQTMVLDKSADEIENYLNNGYIVMALGYQVFRRDYNASTHTIKLAIYFGSFGQVITVVGNQVTGVEEYFYASDENYVHTDNNFTSDDKYKLESLDDYYVDLSSYQTGDVITDSNLVNKLKNERVVVSYNGTAYRFATTMGTGYIYTIMNSLTGGAYITLNYRSEYDDFYFYEVGTASWEIPSNKVQNFNTQTTETYPSTLAVYNYVNDKTDVLVELDANIQIGDIISDQTKVAKLKDPRCIVKMSENGTDFMFTRTVYWNNMYVFISINGDTGGDYFALAESGNNLVFALYETLRWELPTNKVTSLSANSTHTQYPSAKCVYDMIGNVESILNTLNSGGGAS